MSEEIVAFSFPHTIPLSAFDMSAQKKVEQLCNQVILYEDRIEHELEIFADEPPIDEDGNRDKGLPWERLRTYLFAVIRKSSIHGVDVTYIQGSKLYKVTIIATNAEPRFYFKTRTKALDFCNTIKKYIFS